MSGEFLTFCALGWSVWFSEGGVLTGKTHVFLISHHQTTASLRVPAPSRHVDVSALLAGPQAIPVSIDSDHVTVLTNNEEGAAYVRTMRVENPSWEIMSIRVVLRMEKYRAVLHRTGTKASGKKREPTGT